MRNQLDVAIDRDVILYVVLVLFLVFLKEPDHFLSQPDMVILIAVQLIGNCTEKAIAVSACRFEP